MNFPQQIQRLAELFASYPGLEKSPFLAANITKLSKPFTDLLGKAEVAVYRNTADYADLVAVLARKENKKIVTADWFNEWLNQCEVKTPNFTKAGKTEQADFAALMVQHKMADAVVKALTQTPRQVMRNLFDELAGLDEATATARLKKLKAAEFTQFCEFNEIEQAFNKKGKPDKPATLKRALMLVAQRREAAKKV